MEVLISIALVVVGFIVAGLAVRFLPVHPHEPKRPHTTYKLRWRGTPTPLAGSDHEPRS
jgi:hypothetical protein